MLVSMIVINDFSNIKKKVLNCTTESNFILGITKYLKDMLPQNSRIMYYKSGIFNVIIGNYTKKIEKNIFQKIGRIKKVHGTNIILHTVGTHIKEFDTPYEIRERTIKLFSQSLNKNKFDTSVIIVK